MAKYIQYAIPFNKYIRQGSYRLRLCIYSSKRIIKNTHKFVKPNSESTFRV